MCPLSSSHLHEDLVPLTFKEAHSLVNGGQTPLVPVMEDSWWVLSWGMLGPGLGGRGWGEMLFPKGISSPSVEMASLSSLRHPLRVAWNLFKNTDSLAPLQVQECRQGMPALP